MAEITKKDLKEALKGVAKAKDLNELAGDLVRIEKKVDGIDETVKSHTKKLDRIEENLQESKIDSIERRVQKLEQKVGL